MAITGISVLRRDPALANASGLIAGATGRKGDKGDQGNPGERGATGVTGRGISNVAVNSTSHVLVTLSDGTVIDAGAVTVPPPSGADGGVF